MFAKSLIALAAVASFAVAAPIEKKGAPSGWAYGYLEDYDTYHVRYLALKCYDQKKTDFFQDCCRPMLSTETLAANRKAICVPSAEAVAYVTSSLAGQVATPTASADVASESEYCDSEESASSAAPTNAKVAAAYSSSAAATASPVAASPSPSPVAESKAPQYLAPVQSSSTTPKAAPTTSTTPAWTPAPTTAAPTTQAPAPAPTTKAPSNNGETMNGGFATYFYQGGNAGACGTVHGDGDMIVAIDQARWGSSSFGGGSSTCGRWVTVTNTNNGKSVSAMIADVCPTCTNGNSLDLSQGAFRAIANDSDGMVPISWHWN